MDKYNHEHYSDPTPRDALGKVMKDQAEMEAIRNVVQVIIDGEPVAQGRPRFARRGGFVQAYDPKKSKDYKQRIRDEVMPLFYQRAGFTPFTGPCSLTLYVYRPILKSFSMRRREMAEAGLIRPTTKPDTDNYLKGVLDALNTVVFKDDSQFVGMVAQKFYSCEPRIEIIVVEENHE